MTSRTKELAYFADQTYVLDPNQSEVNYAGHSYEVISRNDSVTTGFFAAAYRDRVDGHVVVAYRGTDDIHDGLVDVGMVATRLDLQAAQSELFTANVVRSVTHDGKIPEILVTGHSLGGGLAQLNAERFSLHGETFNAYGTTGLLFHRDEGGTQVTNHVRAGDPVSAASGHFGEVRVYATSEDIRALDAAGYGYDHDFHPGRALAALSASAHSMSNFTDENGQRSIISDDGEALYRSHRKAIDQYRNDIRTSRELTTAAIGHPTEAGLTVATLAAPTAIGIVAGQVIQKADDAVRAAHAVEQAASWTGHVAAEALAPAGTSKAIYGSATGSPDLDKRLSALSITNEGHPGNAMYKQALDEVTKLDERHDRAPDSLSQNLAASLAVEGRRNGMTRIDHVLLSEDASKAYAVQGAMNSPHKVIATVQTELGISASLASSSAAWTQANDSAMQSQQATQAQNQTQQAAIRPHGP